jgi:hypothetical protein
VKPVEVPTGLASDARIAWSRPDRGRLRRLREDTQRLPLINGPDALRNLLGARLSAAATQFKDHAGTTGGARP